MLLGRAGGQIGADFLEGEIVSNGASMWRHGINGAVSAARIDGQNAPSMFPSPRDRGVSTVKVARICAADQCAAKRLP
jgi:hypothetical protein